MLIVYPGQHSAAQYARQPGKGIAKRREAAAAAIRGGQPACSAPCKACRAQRAPALEHRPAAGVAEAARWRVARRAAALAAAMAADPACLGFDVGGLSAKTLGENVNKFRHDRGMPTQQPVVAGSNAAMEKEKRLTLVSEKSQQADLAKLAEGLTTLQALQRGR